MVWNKPEKTVIPFCAKIQPVGGIAPLYPKVISGSLIGETGLYADILPPLDLPVYAWDKRRGQYNAAAIISELEAAKTDSQDMVLAVTDLDLFVPVFSYVFGEARVGGNIAVISTFRLKNNLERVVKVALHEFGHLCSLGHCLADSCLMNFSRSTEQLDRGATYFCRYCRDQIRYYLTAPTEEGL